MAAICGRCHRAVSPSESQCPHCRASFGWTSHTDQDEFRRLAAEGRREAAKERREAAAGILGYSLEIIPYSLWTRISEIPRCFSVMFDRCYDLIIRMYGIAVLVMWIGLISRGLVWVFPSPSLLWYLVLAGGLSAALVTVGELLLGPVGDDGSEERRNLGVHVVRHMVTISLAVWLYYSCVEGPGWSFRLYGHLLLALGCLAVLLIILYLICLVNDQISDFDNLRYFPKRVHVVFTVAVLGAVAGAASTAAGWLVPGPAWLSYISVSGGFFAFVVTAMIFRADWDLFLRVGGGKGPFRLRRLLHIKRMLAFTLLGVWLCCSGIAGLV